MQKIAGLLQFFVRRDQYSFPMILFVKIVGEFLLAEQESGLKIFYRQITNRFPVGRFTLKNETFFYRIHIQSSESSISSFNMNEYMNEKPFIWLRRKRKKNSVQFLYQTRDQRNSENY